MEQKELDVRKYRVFEDFTKEGVVEMISDDRVPLTLRFDSSTMREYFCTLFNTERFRAVEATIELHQMKFIILAEEEGKNRS